MKNPKSENWLQGYLEDQLIGQLLEKVDGELAERVRQGGCLYCSCGTLHRSNYRRLPRGVTKEERQRCDEVYRDSFCCDQEGCRKRHTPPSVRFLGRKVYWAPVVVLVSAVRHGLTGQRLRTLSESLGLDRRTLERWREWWLGVFAQSPFWKAARARFASSIDPETLPKSLCEAFEVGRRDRLLALLKFLSPITTGSIPLERSS